MSEEDPRREQKTKMLSAAMGLWPDDTPFPWQVRLLDRMLVGDLPRSLDVPTGLGKTSTMAIWLVARALGASLPRRLVYVVDRRAVVDQATAEAERLREWVASDFDAERALGLDGRRLPISTLRGQFADNREWLEDPSLPAIVVGTVDMIGSRLLFEGYGTSRRMRPYQAGLLGHDALIALDEAHLVPPFERLIEAMATQQTAGLGPTDASDRLFPLRLLSLSATGRRHGGATFDLSDEDLRDVVVQRRVGAPKRLSIEHLGESESLSAALAERAWGQAMSSSEPARVLVFATSRKVAEAVGKELGERAVAGQPKSRAVPVLEVELLVGARRVFERTDAMATLRTLGFVAGASKRSDRPVVLVATAAGEVGVDLDADHMVCDLAPWERMVQRLGRVNRRGAGDARVTVVVEENVDPNDGLRARHEAVLNLLDRLPKGDDSTRDASPGALVALTRSAGADDAVDRLIEAAVTPAPLYPALERSVVETWSMTSLPEHTGRPEVAPWLRGWEDKRPTVRLVWRAQLPVTPDLRPTSDILDRYVEAAPIHLTEVLEVEVDHALDWLKKRIAVLSKPKTHASGRSGSESETDPGRLREIEHLVACLIGPAGVVEQSYGLAQLGALVRNRQRFERAVADRVLLLHAAVGGLSRGLLDPKSDAPVSTPDLTGAWSDSPESPQVGFRSLCADDPSDIDEDGSWRFREALPLEESPAGEVVRWLVIQKWRVDAATEDDRATSRLQSLEEHQSWAATRAKQITGRLGLPATLAQVIHVATRLHDEGKRSPRWQRAFHAPEGGPYAKTPGPINPHLLDGYRHEFGSLRFAECDPEFQALDRCERDLALHLIAAHHGFARPLLRTDGCDDAPPSVLEGRARDVANRFLRLQDRFGFWGLAYLEAILRAADQQASRDNDARAETRTR